jgi:hypothetical protein
MGLLNGFRQVFDFFTEVTRVARFVTVAGTENGVTVPGPSGTSDVHIQAIHAPGVVVGAPAVIFFRTKHAQAPSFSVRLNATRLTAESLSQAGPHSWHEIIPPGALKPQDNELTLAVTGSGSVTFSDVVILYQSDQLTVKKPLVADPGLADT